MPSPQYPAVLLRSGKLLHFFPAGVLFLCTHNGCVVSHRLEYRVQGHHQSQMQLLLHSSPHSLFQPLFSLCFPLVLLSLCLSSLLSLPCFAPSFSLFLSPPVVFSLFLVVV